MQGFWSRALPLLVFGVLRAPAGFGAEPVLAPSTVDVNNSRVLVKVGAAGLGHVHGVSGRLASGRLVLGGRGELRFDMKTFAADLPEVRTALGLTKAVPASDQKSATNNMLGRDVLDVARFPTATFLIDSTTPMDKQTPGKPGRYRLEGVFTLHGVKRPLAVDVVLEPTNNPAFLRIRGTFSILQTQSSGITASAARRFPPPRGRPTRHHR